MQLASLLAIAAVCLATVSVGSLGLRMSRATSDFYVAGRAITPRRNASAIAGEYLSAASFLGVAGLIWQSGIDILWFPIGYTVGYLVLLVLIAAPLRRSGAYTLSDFTELRLESRPLRAFASLLIIGIGILYVLPQVQGAGLALRQATGWPTWAGSAVVAVVVFLAVAAGGMRSITLVQAMQYWIKLTAIAIPAFVLLAIWSRGDVGSVDFGDWAIPSTDPVGLYTTYSTMLALCLGTMGLPHVLVRFYTNPDGRDARRTTVGVIGLLAVFYLFPPIYGALGRLELPRLAPGSRLDTMALQLPGAMTDGLLATVLTAMLAGGAFAAFLSTTSGLIVSVAGVIDQDVLRPLIARRSGEDARGAATYRLATAIAVLLPFVLSRLLDPLGLATTVTLAFAVAASTFAPLLVLGVWWPRLTTVGAAAGLGVGTLCALISLTGAFLRVDPGDGWLAALIARPAAWTAPLAFATMVIVSHLTPSRRPPHTNRTLNRLHTPESLLPP
ncbi:cation acetate symporter [Nostocoides veronense]|uniref:Na+/solute symporter n=1 Tax=Nostocoides veronense TaxID=330836 RepID=A0ABN2LBX9_9MICO